MKHQDPYAHEMARYNDAPIGHRYFYLPEPLRYHVDDGSLKQKKILKDDFLPHKTQGV